MNMIYWFKKKKKVIKWTEYLNMLYKVYSKILLIQLT